MAGEDGLLRRSDVRERTRVFVDELDSVECRRIYDEAATAEEARSRVVTAIRMALVVGDEIVLSEAMLFDSMFFASVGPTDLAGLLGCSSLELPLRLLCTKRTAAAALAALKTREPAMRWQLGGPGAKADWYALPKHDHVREAWRVWCDAVDRGLIQVEHVPDEQLAVRPSFSHLHVDPLGRAQEFLSWLTDDRYLNDSGVDARRRSEIDDEYERLLAEAPPSDREALGLLRGAWNDAYLDAMSNEHEAEWLRSSGSPILSKSTRRRTVRVSGRVVEQVRGMSPAAFSLLLYTCSSARTAFIEDRKPRTARALAFAMARAYSPTSLGATKANLMARFVIAAVALVAALPSVAQAEAGYVAWSVFAGLVIVTTPWADLLAWRRSTGGALDALLSVERS